MRSGGPLRRKTPLRAKPQPPKPRAQIRRKRDQPRRRSRALEAAGEVREDGWSAETRREVRLRSKGVCEMSGCNFPATEMHHRKLRAHGDHRAVNCLHTCRGHHAWIHANPIESYRHGLLVRSTLDPAAVEVVAVDVPLG